jgi:hypothetical protein
MIVRLKATAIYPNCPRYIPRMQFVEPSQYAPRPGEAFPEPAWKSFPEFKDAVHPRQKTTTIPIARVRGGRRPPSGMPMI